MLVPAWYILRKLLFTGRADAHTIYPFVHHMSNVQTAADLTRAITLPGVPGARPPPPTPLSMNLVASTLEELFLRTVEESRERPGRRFVPEDAPASDEEPAANESE